MIIIERFCDIKTQIMFYMSDNRSIHCNANTSNTSSAKIGPDERKSIMPCACVAETCTCGYHKKDTILLIIL